MARPRKHTGYVENLYRDCRNREGYYRYRRPDGSFKLFQAPSLAEANRIAEANNARRDEPRLAVPLNRAELAFHIPEYIAYRQKQDAKLEHKSSWKNRAGALRAFGDYFEGTHVNEIIWPHLSTWWEGLTYHQQKLRHAEFRRLFNWLMGQGLCQQLTYNPFTTDDSKVRLLVTGEPEKARMRLSRDAFWSIYDAAEHYPALQIAMGISLLTFMRESDICTLRLSENVEGELLKRVIGKSLNQRGSASASRLQWDLGNDSFLKALIKRAREEAMRNYRCPFVISHTGKTKKTGKTKEHGCQVTPRRLIEMFSECRDATGLYKNLPQGRTAPTFHEIRSLASKLATDAGYSDQQIQLAMAHGDVATTRSYKDEHQLPFENAGIVLTPEVLGRSF
ncbi:MAG: tyrosine-type recombinase/integrase [Pseudomonadota bacterium]